VADGTLLSDKRSAQVTADQLALIMLRATPKRIEAFVEPLNHAMYDWAIDEQPARIAAFIAQLAHESGEFRYTQEIASGAAYEGRKRSRQHAARRWQALQGRGLIQITGRANYTDCSDALYEDARLLSTPELLELPDGACDSAGWFWCAHGLNELADAGKFDSITRVINGGVNGYAERVEYWQRAKIVFGVE
jgi:putative chitinase